MPGRIRFVLTSYRMTSDYGPQAEGSFSLFGTEQSAEVSGPLGTATWSCERVAPGHTYVGVWSMTATIQQVPWSLQWTIDPNERYRLTSRTTDSGTFSVKDGTWVMHSARGVPQNGTFTRLDDRTVTMAGPLGTRSVRLPGPSRDSLGRRRHSDVCCKTLRPTSVM